jgi:hypothetical protein
MDVVRHDRICLEINGESIEQIRQQASHPRATMLVLPAQQELAPRAAGEHMVGPLGSTR